jgi:hypothetical protein
MKRIAASLTMAMAMVVLAVTASLAGKVLFEDKFTFMDLGWGVATGNAYVKDGKFIISPSIKTGFNAFNQSAFLPNDMDASVTLNFQKVAADNHAAGLLFWVNSATEYYGFEVVPNGSFGVIRSVAGGRYLTPVPWQLSDAIKKGEGVDNVLRVVTKGTQATVYINGQQVATFSGQPPTGGSQIGLGGSSGDTAPNVVAFSNLTVMEP